jgi:catechol 2,3-dioxygenase-like lactoylglutathione lyase family enzyme
MLDHIYISVADVERSLAFYTRTLEPLGWTRLGNYSSAGGPSTVPDLHGLGDSAYGSGAAVGSSIWLRQREAGETGLYVGFVADTEAEVVAAYKAAIAAGGADQGAPAVRAYFGPSYYAANVVDFDGNRLEIVHKGFNPAHRRERS